MVVAVIGMAAALVGAVCSLLCLRKLLREGTPPQGRPEPEEDGGEDEGDAALREGILNLMRYAPGETGKKEE